MDLLKPVTHLAIFADRGDWRKSPGVPGAAMAIFADRCIKSPISGMSEISAIKFAGIRQVCPFQRFFTPIASNRHQIQPIRIRLGDFITWAFKMAETNAENGLDVV